MNAPHRGVRLVASVATADGGSRFEESWIDFASDDGACAVTAAIPAAHVSFRLTPGEFDFDFHRAPRRRLVLVLEGGIEAKVSTGEVRVFRPGDVWELRDTTGVGHCSKAYRGEPFRTAFVALDEEVTLDRRVRLDAPVTGGAPVRTLMRDASGRWRSGVAALDFAYGGVEGAVTEEIPTLSAAFSFAYAPFSRPLPEIARRQIDAPLTGRLSLSAGATRIDVPAGELLMRDPAAAQALIRAHGVEPAEPALTLHVALRD